MRSKGIHAALAALLLLPPALTAATPGRYGETMPAAPESFQVAPTDPGARPARKTAGFWHRRPAATAAAAQLARAAAAERAGELRSATGAYDALVRQWPESAEAAAAQLGVARLLERRRKYARAFDEYLYLLHYYADRLPVEGALQRMFAIANHYRGKGSDGRARVMFEQVARLAPQWSRTPAAWLQVGLLQQEAGDTIEAAATFERLVGDYPGSAEAGEAATQAAFCRVRLARRYANDEAIGARALAALSAALRDHPDHPAHARLQQEFDDLLTRRMEQQFATSAFYDSPRHPPSAAIAAYTEFLRRFPDAPQAAQARGRLAALTAAAPPPSSNMHEGEDKP
jgi:TolA-binding protein